MPAPQLAITLDDFPSMWMEDLPAGSVSLGDDRRLLAARHILDAIRRHSLPAAVFVNSGRCGQDELAQLREWCEAGVELGNHTANHLCVDSISEADWQADVLSCHRTLSAVTPSPPRFFRFPFLRTGNSFDRRRAAEAFLTETGYTIAPVTAVTSEWLLAHYYQLALQAQSPPLLQRIAARLIPHVMASLDAAERLARACVRRVIPQIVLLHVNALTAHSLDELIEVLGRKYQFISIAEALRDPVFAMPDRYSGARGMSWLARVGGRIDAETSAGRASLANQRRAIVREFRPVLGWPAAPRLIT